MEIGWLEVIMNRKGMQSQGRDDYHRPRRGKRDEGGLGG